VLKRLQFIDSSKDNHVSMSSGLFSAARRTEHHS